MEKPVRVARRLSRFELVLDRALGRVVAEIWRLWQETWFRRVEAVAGDARRLRIRLGQHLPELRAREDLGLRGIRLERQMAVLGARGVLADGHDVGPILVASEHDEVDELLDLLVVERPALLVAPRGHRDLPRRPRAAP